MIKQSVTFDYLLPNELLRFEEIKKVIIIIFTHKHLILQKFTKKLEPNFEEVYIKHIISPKKIFANIKFFLCRN